MGGITSFSEWRLGRWNVLFARRAEGCLVEYGEGKFGDFVMSHILAVSFALVDLRQ